MSREEIPTLKELWSTIKEAVVEDKNFREAYFLLPFAIVLSHMVLYVVGSSWAAYLILAGFQIMTALVLFSNSCGNLIAKAQRELVDEAITCVNTMERRHHLDQQRIKHLEDTLAAYLGHPEEEEEELEEDTSKEMLN